MLAAFHDDQLVHRGSHFIVDGNQRANPERPERALAFLEALKAAGIAVDTPDTNTGERALAMVHSPDYIDFLKNGHRRWRESGGGEEIVPKIHPAGAGLSYTEDMEGLAGYYQRDNAVPIGAGTFTSIRASAATAHHVAAAVAASGGSGYALCRPGGHHAARAGAMGFCYLNNAAIAAQTLAGSRRRVAIVDIDVHHGNGTQEIFYDRDDVLTLSIHADPVRFYPFFWGYADERGRGVGRGANRNIPLPRGATDVVWLDALDGALAAVAAFAPSAMVVSLGLDGHRDDPLGGFDLSTAAFAAAGTRLASLGLPTVIIQEGGYLHDQLGPSLVAFLGAFIH